VRPVSTPVDTEPGRGERANGCGRAKKDGPEDPLEVLRSLGIRSDVAAERLRLAREALEGREPAEES